jgi:hypothetical protein
LQFHVYCFHYEPVRGAGFLGQDADFGEHDPVAGVIVLRLVQSAVVVEFLEVRVDIAERSSGPRYILPRFIVLKCLKVKAQVVFDGTDQPRETDMK